VSSVPRATVHTLKPKIPKKPKSLNLFLKTLSFFTSRESYQGCPDPF